MKKNILVSIIIPTYNSGDFIYALLESTNKQTYKHIEVIVVDNNSKDSTKEIAKKFTSHVYNKGPERSAQRNYGVKQSKGDYVLIIDSDMVLAENLVEECLELLENNKDLKAITVPEQSFGEGFWSKCKILERSFYLGVDWMESARFFERKLFEEMGSYDERNTGTEDYDLPQRIKEKYGMKVIGRVDAFIFHNEQRLSLVKTCKKKFYYAQRLDVYSKKQDNQEYFKKQASIFERYKLFFSNPAKLFKNPIVGLGMLFMKTSEFVCGGTGYLYGQLKR